MSLSNPLPRAARDGERGRARTVLLVFSLVTLAVVARLVQLQVVEHGRWAALAKATQERTLDVPPRRGTIYDRSGVPLAYDVKARGIAIDSLNMTKPEALVALLNKELGIPVASLQRLIYRPSYFTWIDRKVDLATVARIEAEAKKARAYGLLFFETWKRCYPEGDLASNLLGFVGTDGAGLEGVERQFETLLAGTPDRVEILKGADGRTYETRVLEKGKPGQDLVLTIDSRFQHICEEEVSRGTQEKQGKAGFVVAMDPRTGEILAMAQSRRYDLNRFAQSSAEDRRNLPVSFLCEPGSSFKTFSALAALECGAVSTNDVFNGNDGYAVAGHPFHNAGKVSYGTVNLAKILKMSINAGIIQVAQQVGEERFHQALVNLGFGQKTGIALPGEEAGILRPVEEWSGLELATLSFGQGIAVTGVQLVRAFAAVANGGILLEPQIVVRPADGKKPAGPTVVRQVASPATCRTMTDLLCGVVMDSDGTAPAARVAGFKVAGKTGTAQKALPGQGYVPGRYTALFAGYLPAEAPALVLLCVIDEPAGGAGGGLAAAPIFGRAAARIAALDHLAPVASVSSR